MAMNIDMKSLVEMIDSMLSGIGIFELRQEKMSLLYMNEGGYRMLGYSPEEGTRYVNSLLSLIVEEDKQIFWQGVEDVMRDNGAIEIEFRTVTANGGLRWIQARGNLYSMDSEKAIIVGVFMDATDRKNVAEELRMQYESYQLLSASEGEVLFDYNATTDVMVFKTAHKKDYSKDIIMDRFLHGVETNQKGSEEMKQCLNLFLEALRIPKSDSEEVFLSLKPGMAPKWYRLSVTSIAGVDGYVTHIVGKFNDITESKVKLKPLYQSTEKDSLTGWYNAEIAKKKIDEILKYSNEDEMHAFLIVDLDNFKKVNDTLGHSKGDEVLKIVSRRMSSLLKHSDVLGRIGGDEFVLFAKNIDSISEIDDLAVKLCRTTELKLDQEFDELKITGSIGVSIFPYHGKSYQELFDKADQAMYKVKGQEKAGYRIYNATEMLTSHIIKNGNRKEEQEESEEEFSDIIQQILYEDKYRETSIRSALELTANHFGFQKAFLASYNNEKEEDREYWYYLPGYESSESKGTEEAFDYSIFEGLLTENACHIVYNYDEQMTPELSKYMLEHKVQVLVFQPMIVNGVLKGIFLLENCIEDEMISSEKENALKDMIRLILLHLMRFNKSEQMQDSISQLKVLDDFDSYIYLIDKDTYEICFVNKKVKEITPEVVPGNTCYRAIMHQESPCEDCILNHLGKNDSHARYSEECFNHSLRKWTKSHVSWFRNSKEQNIGIVNCVDISDYFMQ